jgi:surface protein
VYINNTDKPLKIGAGGDSANELRLKNGTLMDDFRFYNRVLSAAEISTIVTSAIPVTSSSYNFDGNPNDTSGNGNHLSSLNNVAYTTVDYRLGTHAASFSGSNYFEIANDGRFSPNDFTVAFWIKPVSSAGTYQSIATCRNGFTFTGWMIYIDPTNDLVFMTGSETGWSYTPDVLYAGIGTAYTWVHVAFCLSKSTSSCGVYVNGTLKTTIARTYTNNMDKPLRIGAGGDSAAGELFLKPGTLMDDFRFYSRVLSAAEISTIVASAIPVPFWIASYNFDGNPNDSSGSNNHLSSINNVAYATADYRLGTHAASFSGSNYFEIANDGRFSPNNLTVAFWIKPASSAGAYQSIATCRNGFTFTGWMIYINPNNDLVFMTGSGTGWSYTPDVLYAGIGTEYTWVHIAFCLSKYTSSSASTCEVYVNGTLKTTITRTYANNADKPLRIGAGGDSAAGELFLKPGTLMDDFRVYNRVLSASEISTIVASAIPAPLSSFLVASYNFDGNPRDSSGSNNHLSFINSFAYTTADYITAASFSGSNYFEIANDGRFSPDNLTVAFFIKHNSTPGAYQTIASCRNGTTFTGWVIFINPNNHLEFWTGTGSTWSNAGYTDIGNANTWVHLAFCLSKSASSCEVYVNGTLKTTIARTYTKNNDKPLRIGAGGDSAAGELFLKSGTFMYDFKLYNRVLTNVEINSIISNATALSPGFPLLSLDSNGVTIKYNGNGANVPANAARFIQANVRGTTEWFAVIKEGMKYQMQLYAHRNLSAPFTSFGQSAVPFNNIVTTLLTNTNGMFVDDKNVAGVFNNEFNQPIGSWDLSNVTDMLGMLNKLTVFNQPIGAWNTANATSMQNMFGIASVFNQPIGSWNTAKVTDMQYMFSSAAMFNQNISGWNVALVTKYTDFATGSGLLITNIPPKFR